MGADKLQPANDVVRWAGCGSAPDKRNVDCRPSVSANPVRHAAIHWPRSSSCRESCNCRDRGFRTGFELQNSLAVNVTEVQRGPRVGSFAQSSRPEAIPCCRMQQRSIWLIWPLGPSGLHTMCPNMLQPNYEKQHKSEHKSKKTCTAGLVPALYVNGSQPVLWRNRMARTSASDILACSTALRW